MRSLLVALLFASAWWSAGSGAAPSVVRDLPPGLHVPAAAQPGPDFDVERATAAWLDLLSPEQRVMSDAYFEGEYWLQLWRLLYGLGVMALLVVTGAARRMRDAAVRLVRRRNVANVLFAAMFLVSITLLNLPLAIYADFYREHAYGLSNQTFAGWLRDGAIGLLFLVVVGAPAIALAYAAVRRTREQWWLWATALTFVFVLVTSIVFPVFFAPLLNDYKPLPPGPVRESVLQLARANSIPTEHLDWYDASRQTTRISANVSGVLGFARINLNDNLLNKTSHPEIHAVLAHEMGHYVMHHTFQLSVYFTLLAGIAFAVVNALANRFLARWGSRFGVTDVADPAGLPIVVALLSTVWFLLTPLLNTTTRTIEVEADAFGLNAAREPQAFAMVIMRLSTYRKIHPGPIEEFVFYDHPSGYQRVRRAMLWQRENMPR